MSVNWRWRWNVRLNVNVTWPAITFSPERCQSWSSPKLRLVTVFTTLSRFWIHAWNRPVSGQSKNTPELQTTTSDRALPSSFLLSLRHVTCPRSFQQCGSHLHRTILYLLSFTSKSLPSCAVQLFKSHREAQVLPGLLIVLRWLRGRIKVKYDWRLKFTFVES